MVTSVREIEAAKTIRAMGVAVGEALEARCVLLFGSRARGDHKVYSDVDLAVIIEAANSPLGSQERIRLQQQGAAAAQAIRGNLFHHVDVRVWTEPEYRDRKRSINHVAGRSWREGKLLFGFHETLPGEDVVAELPHARELIGMARGQLNTMNFLSGNDAREEDFGFHAQRAAELALKAWIAFAGHQYQLTHFLQRLIDQLQQAGVSEASQFRDLASLTNYAVVYQYQSVESPTMDRERVTADVRNLVEYVAAILEQAETE